jgi:hypothetical protein
MLQKAGEAVVEKVQVVVEEVKEVASEAKETIMGPLAGAGKTVRPLFLAGLALPAQLPFLNRTSRKRRKAKKPYVTIHYLGNCTNLFFRTLLFASYVSHSAISGQDRSGRVVKKIRNRMETRI